MDRPTELTPVAQDYLKVVWSAQEWSQEPVTTKLLAERIGVGASTVSETVRRLSSQGLLEHARYGAIELTDAGRTHALAMVRRHRLIETYLVSELGYSWDEVHDEAEVLEHAVSDLMIERIDARLGNPVRDPHGDPIPTADGRLVRPDALPLADLEVGERGVVARISDADPDVLRYVAELDLGLDAVVSVREKRAYAGTMTIAWTPPGDEPGDDGSEGSPERVVQLGLTAADQVWVVLGGSGDGAPPAAEPADTP